MKKIKVSGAQFAIEPNKIKENTEKSCHYIEKAWKEEKPYLIALPETITTGFTPNMPQDDFYNMVEPLRGPSVKKVCALAKKLKVWVVFPTYTKGKKKNQVFNSAVVISNKGDIKGVYSKTHPFPGERGWTTPGTTVNVFDIGAAKIGITICYEGDFPELSRILALKGAEIIIRPAALLRSYEIWEMTNKARAYDNHCYVLAVNATGQDAGGNCFFGHSMVISPIAQKLAQARAAEEILHCELDPDPMKFITYGTRTPQTFDHIEDRNVKLYKTLLKTGKCPFEPAKRIPYKR